MSFKILLPKTRPTPFSKIKIASGRVVVRPYQLSDFKRCQASHMTRRPKVNEFDNEIHASKDSTYVQFKSRIEQHRKIGRDGHQFIFGVFDVKSLEHVGEVGLMTINKQLRWGNLGYQIHNQHWSRGYASEAARLALKIAFQHLNFHRIEAGTEPKNKASIRVAEKIGMRFEGMREKFFPVKGGMDMVVYGANAIDFKRRKSKSR
jgi:ribosomal-protein-alanine N-acetyltransferase